jgi:membrane fusion protein (multidrug efflux system)
MNLYLFCFQPLYLLALLSSLLLGCNKEKPAHQILPIDVAIVKIESKTIPAVFEYIGVVQSSHEVEIRARVTGYLETIGYLEGSYVQKGDLLFQLDPRPFQAALAKARAQLAREQAVLWQAQRAVKRFTPLYEQKAASQRDLDNAIASQMTAQAQVMEAQAQVADAEINLSYTTIRSPVSGLASQAKYRVGSLISPSQDLLTTVSVIDPIWVNFSISEQDILSSEDEIRKGTLVFPPHQEFQIELILADQSVFPEKGTVNFASPSYSQKTGTLMIRAVLPNPHDLLRPGQFVRVRIYGAARPNAIVVPQQAVQQGQYGSFVFVVNANNQAEVRPIDPGPWDGDNWVIWKGLNPGDLVIVSGVNKVLPGSPVKVIKDMQVSEKQKQAEEQKQSEKQKGNPSV